MKTRWMVPLLFDFQKKNLSFRLVCPEDSAAWGEITDIQYWFSAKFLTLCLRISKHFDDIMYCRWWNIQTRDIVCHNSAHLYFYGALLYPVTLQTCARLPFLVATSSSSCFCLVPLTFPVFCCPDFLRHVPAISLKMHRLMCCVLVSVESKGAVIKLLNIEYEKKYPNVQVPVSQIWIFDFISHIHLTDLP